MIADLGAALEARVDELVAAAIDRRLAALGLTPSDHDPIVRVELPLSRKRTAAICREGKITGARKEGRVWLARRSAIAAYLDGLPARAPAPAQAPSGDALDAELDALGFNGNGSANDSARSAEGASR